MTWISQTTSADQGLIYDEATGRNIAVAYDSEDGPRIVACVNACEGINPEAVGELLEAAKDMAEVWRYLEESAADARWGSVADAIEDRNHGCNRRVRDFRAAIAKAERGTP